MNALGFPILYVLLAVQLAGGVWIWFAPGSEAGRAQNGRVIALGATLSDFALGILLWLNVDSSTAAVQFQEDVPLFAPWFSWKLGIDGIALMLIQLSVFLMPICILASWRSIERRVPEYMAAFLLLETLMLGEFAAQDLFLFYIFFEAGLIPLRSEARRLRKGCVRTCR